MLTTKEILVRAERLMLSGESLNNKSTKAEAEADTGVSTPVSTVRFVSPHTRSEIDVYHDADVWAQAWNLGAHDPYDFYNDNGW